MRHMSVLPGSPRGFATTLCLTALVAGSACTPWITHAPASGGVGPPLTAYPWADDTTQDVDPYGMTKRQCVSFVAWYINSHGTSFGRHTRGPAGVGVFGEATTWDAAARDAGFTVGAMPRVGSIAQWHTDETSSWTIPGGRWGQITAGPSGHVAVVTAVHRDGSVDIAQYNIGGDRSYSTLSHVYAPRYIYIPLASPQAIRARAIHRP